MMNKYFTKTITFISTEIWNYSYKFSRVLIFAQIRAQRLKCAKFNTFITRSKEVRENKSARKFSKHTFLKFSIIACYSVRFTCFLYIFNLGARKLIRAKIFKFQGARKLIRAKIFKFRAARVRENKYARKFIRIRYILLAETCSNDSWMIDLCTCHSSAVYE